MSPHFCGAVQIFDLVNSTYAQLARESERIAKLDWLQATAALSEADNPAAADAQLVENTFLTSCAYFSSEK